MNFSKFKRKCYLSLIPVAVMALVLVFSTSAYPLQVTLTGRDAGNNIIGVETISESVPGMINWNGLIGNNFNVLNLFVASTVISIPENPSLFSYTIALTTTAGGTLDISISDQNFGPIHPMLGGFNSQISGATDGSVTFDTYFDDTNVLHGTGTQIASLDSLTGPLPIGFNNSALHNGTPAGTPGTNQFSLTMDIGITHTTAGQMTNFTAAINAVPKVPVPPIGAVPEPSTILLSGIGLLGLGLVGQKKKRGVKA